MNVEDKERLANLLDDYCNEHGCIPIGSHLMCNAECRFNCPIKYCVDNGESTGCPLLDIRNQIRKECDE